MEKMRNLLKRHRIGRISQLLSPDWYSWCGKCKTTWFFVDPHNTDYTNGRGIFCLCKKCWGELEPIGRLRYYKEVVDSWESLEPGVRDEVWGLVEQAVLEGR